MKFFKKIALRTGYYVFDELGMLMGAVLYILPVTLYFAVNLPCAILSAVLLFIAIALLVRNKIFSPFGLVVLLILVHLIIGVFGIVIIMVRNILALTGKVKKINYAGLCWSNERRYDDERAREYGYKSVDDAINAGVMFDGTKLW